MTYRRDRARRDRRRDRIARWPEWASYPSVRGVRRNAPWFVLAPSAYHLNVLNRMEPS